MLTGFFVSFVLGVFGTITNLVMLLDEDFSSSTTGEKLQVIAFLVAFALIALASLMLFVARLLRLLTDIKINKENK
ncbi:MAG: hypothetical protein JXR38_03890 [Bacilli bacterium]|nr:hypothetical protein [Bacilli bacterium]